MKPKDATFIPCQAFGGGWIVPDTDAGQDWLEEFFGDEPYSLAPIAGQRGWIVEPQETGPLAESAAGQIIIELQP